MTSFAGDHRLASADLQLLREAVGGRKEALYRATERFHPVILALLYSHTKDFSTAVTLVDRLTEGLFQSLLRGEFLPEELAGAAEGRVLAACSQGIGGSAEEESGGLEGLHKAKKLMRRRAANAAVLELPLPALTAMVLRYHAGWTTRQMVGIVADDEENVRDTLLSAHRAAVEAMSREGQ